MIEYIGLRYLADLKNTIVLLDGYDEISFVSRRADQNKAYYHRLELDYPGKKLIITS